MPVPSPVNVNDSPAGDSPTLPESVNSPLLLRATERLLAKLIGRDRVRPLFTLTSARPLVALASGYPCRTACSCWKPSKVSALSCGLTSKRNAH